ncbi:hypothetical protein [Tropicimonas sp. IMCC6043]|uniref:hypothetical protein n=1 Tax=Tropicimonas sp. IMCC6043 TaxID=2510645 RepID=UPI00101B725B|nr:hypothetical protein [Tropicimonas sp. IMCC6043]RYH09593.1 hypothetical protein EU800_11625 [Tropicimonas sp. IMCC6043]
MTATAPLPRNPAAPAWPVLLAVGLIAITIRLTFLSGGPDRLDRLFFPDDTYYLLTIARNIAAGAGPSIDGVTLTTGFQPLIVAFLVPVFLLMDNPEMAAVALAAITALFGVLANVLAAWLALVLTQSRLAATGVGLLIATGPVFVVSHLNGLETSLAAATLLAVALLVLRTPPGAGLGRFLAIGVLSGLAILARVDSALALIPIAAFGVMRHGWRPLLPVGLAAAAVMAPWVAFCLAVGGTPIPESGSAVRHIASLHVFTPIQTALMGLLALGAIFPSGLFEPSLPFALTVAAILALPLAIAIVERRMTAVTALALSCLLLLAAYALWLRAFWFFDRYFSPIYTLVPIIAAALIFERLPRRPARRLWAMLTLVLCSLNFTALALHAARPVITSARAFAPPMAYAAVARDLLPRLPAGTVLGAKQSGALTYFAPETIRVVNLDGVVNGPAAAAARTNRMCGYIAAQGVTHFADWELNARFLSREVAAGESVELDLLGLSEVIQDRNRYGLYAVTPRCATVRTAATGQKHPA